MQDRLEEMMAVIQMLSGEVGRSSENCAVQDILFSIHQELVFLRERLKTIEAAGLPKVEGNRETEQPPK